MSKKKIEIKTIKFKVEDADEKGDHGRLSGVLSPFGNVDNGMDVVERGAFNATLKANKAFPLLLDHNPSEPAGFFSAHEERKGLVIDAELKLFDPRVKQRFELAKLAIKSGAPMGLSIGYSAIKFEFEKDEDTDQMIRRLKELKLWEGSLVTFPMNETARVGDAKSEIIDRLNSGAYTIDQLNDAVSQFNLKNEKPANGKIDPDLIQSIMKLGKLKY